MTATLTKPVTINGREISPNHPPYIVAEVSANHNGDMQRALDTITMAAECGADAVKIQTYTADTITIDCDNPEFKINGGLWDGHTLHSLYQWAHTPYEWHPAMFEHAKKLGVTLFSSPFDFTAVDLLEELDAPAYKIASFEAIDLPLIRRVAQTGKPMIMSTGMTTPDEINDAVNMARDHGCENPIVLHCVSSYPAPANIYNLRAIQTLQQQYNVLSGLSDHTLGVTTAIASVALGACLIEKHVTLSRADKGPDSEFSLEPDELRELCTATKTAWQALGNGELIRGDDEKKNRSLRRSLYAVTDIAKGETLTPENVRSIRPGYGLAPKHYDEVLGQTALQDLPKGTALNWDAITR